MPIFPVPRTPCGARAKAMGGRRVVSYGRFYEDFEVGSVLDHHWGRTITQAEGQLFATWTMNASPLYFNEVYARAQGHPTTPIHPLLVMNVVFGLSVEDLSEQALAHLGYWRMRFPKPVYPGDTLLSRSEVLDKRLSDSKDDRGIVHVRTSGTNQHGDEVLSYERKILVKKRAAYPVLDKAPGSAAVASGSGKHGG
ncbi:MaoC family dehydratase [Vulgatibacter incomptus]|uniref:MaoC family dehydratase n=1 Tax=Vulgatibacter incomptus TaxID=1391653 RepID=UPI0012F944AD|nr:MaoC family dehydratase [Vulgatibacter incomptus]